MGLFDNTPKTPQLPFPVSLIPAFKEFCNNMHDDPKQQVQELLNSGRMTQEQYKKLNDMYQQYGQFFK